MAGGGKTESYDLGWAWRQGRHQLNDSYEGDKHCQVDTDHGGGHNTYGKCYSLTMGKQMGN